MKLFALSDLHIKSPEDPLYHSLLNILTEKANSEDIVVLGGDVFDLFVGNKKIFKLRYSSFIDALKRASKKGIRIHYIEGNHDFLLKTALPSISGVEVHSTSVSIDCSGKRFFIAHGDLVDSWDIGYRTLRFFFRSPFMKFLVTALPGIWLDQIGSVSSNFSRKMSSRKELGIETFSMHKKRQLMRTTFRNFAVSKIRQGADFVILGHCHDLDEMEFRIGDRFGHYVNMGYPPSHGTYLTWTPGKLRMERESL